MHQQSGKSPISKHEAGEIAIRVLTFLSSEPDHMSSFMALSGMALDDIAQNASSSTFQAALLDHLMSDETLLLTFCGNENIDPQLIAPAHHLLSRGGSETYGW